jgi:hypothetical protein
MSKFTAADVQAFTASLYGARRLNIVPYGYTVTFLALAQNAQQTQTLNITGNADFILTAINARSQIGAIQNVGNKTAPFVRLLIVDGGSNEQFTNSAVDLENYCTNGVNESGGLPYMRFISGRTALILTATNYAPTAETYTSIDVFLEGVLIRAFSGS